MPRINTSTIEQHSKRRAPRTTTTPAREDLARQLIKRDDAGERLGFLRDLLQRRDKAAAELQAAERERSDIELAERVAWQTWAEKRGSTEPPQPRVADRENVAIRISNARGLLTSIEQAIRNRGGAEQTVMEEHADAIKATDPLIDAVLSEEAERIGAAYARLLREIGPYETALLMLRDLFEKRGAHNARERVGTLLKFGPSGFDGSSETLQARADAASTRRHEMAHEWVKLCSSLLTDPSAQPALPGVDLGDEP